jgi:hypothetical protein
MFEKGHEDVITSREFLARMLKALGIASLLVLFTLLLGSSGYHWIAGLKWIDAVYNASMILTGMGPVDLMPDESAKVFASTYALFCAMSAVIISAIILAPIAHRTLHIFHHRRQ